jgi:hypothetical protein
MSRTTLIVAEPEPREALAVRKLVIETAKFDVLRAHGTRECRDLFQTFPMGGIVILVEDGFINIEYCASRIKKSYRHIPIIALTPRVAEKFESVDHTLSSHEPEPVVKLIRSLAGDPRDLDRRTNQHQNA